VLEAIAEYSVDECTADLQRYLKDSKAVAPEMYYVMKRLRALFDEDVDGVGDAAYLLHSTARGYLTFNPSMDIMMTVVASPHMANLLFSDEEDLLSKKNRMIKHQFAKYNGRPTEEFIEDTEDAAGMIKVKKLLDEYDELDNSMWGGQPSSMSYCYLYFNLIVACAVHGTPCATSVHDGRGTLRGGDPCNKSAKSLLATAALRRAMELWTDPLVMASCGDAMAPAASLALSALDYYTGHDMFGAPPLCRKYELAPGLAIDRVAMACMSELLDGAGSAQYAIKVLRSLGGMAITDWEGDKEPWTGMPIERRAKFALATIRFIDSGDEQSQFGRDLEMPMGAVNDLLKTICGMQNPKNGDIAKSVWQKAADDGEFLSPFGAGFNAQYRAFFYYFLRGNFLLREWGSVGWGQQDAMDVVKIYKEYDEIPFSHMAPKDDVKAKEKDECLRLAYGNKRHEERNEMFRSIHK